jgi:hypothetical protein
MMPQTEMHAAHEPTRAELFARLEAADQAVKAALTAEQYALVNDLNEAQTDFRTLENRTVDARFVDALARHFPGLEPAIRTIARHAWTAANDFEPERRKCNLVRDDAPELMLSWCDESDGAA